jgi:hypothetical protein
MGLLEFFARKGTLPFLISYVLRTVHVPLGAVEGLALGFGENPNEEWSEGLDCVLIAIA